MMTKDEYLKSLKKLHINAWMFGEKLKHPYDNPVLLPSIGSLAATYAAAEDPAFNDLMTATSVLSGKTINRFVHLHQSTEDLIKKVKMQRMLGQRTASCFQRCVGMDAANAVYATTFEVDETHGTRYHDNFVRFWMMIEETDFAVDGAMTDVKGDRSLPPSKQVDPDLYLHVTRRTREGVYVTGAKAHQTGYLNSHYMIVMPTISMKEGDEDYAIAFALPTDAEGITAIYGRQPSDTRKLEAHNDIDVGNKLYGGQEVLVIFEDVFVPNEMIFLNGETDFCGMLVERFAGYHRQSYGGCKSGVADVLIGASALAAEMGGYEKASHIKEKLIEMTHLNETIYACGIACASQGTKLPAGNYIIDLLLANVCKQHVTRFPFDMARMAQDIAGGMVGTLPSQADWDNKHLHPLLDKYLKGVSTVPTEDRMRISRLIENLTMGTGAIVFLTESLHGAGSPQAQRIMIARQANFPQKKHLARRIAQIE